MEYDVGNIYDNAEKQIGLWFGKPLYRSVHLFNSPNTTTPTNIINLSHLNIKLIVHLYGFITYDGCEVPINNYYGSETDFTRVFYGNVSKCIRVTIGSYNALKNAPMRIIIEYTKNE